MTTPHVIASSSPHPSQSSSSNGIVGSHYRVGKKIGEGSFGVVFEGMYVLYHVPTRRPIVCWIPQPPSCVLHRSTEKVAHTPLVWFMVIDNDCLGLVGERVFGR